MPLIALTCPACGAPLPSSSSPTLVCAYCASTLVGGEDTRWEAWARGVEEELPDSGGRPSCRVAGQKFFLRGLLGRGTHGDVWFAERARRLAELVVLKVSREDASADALSAEWRLVSDLGTRTSPVSRLARLLPEPVARGAFTRAGHSSRPAIVYRWRSGFLYTLRDVRAAYPAGIDARTAVWIWRRLLDLLGGLHETGVSHGAVFPEHVLLHPRDHAIRLVGWSSARALGRDSTLAARDLAASAETLRFALARTDVPGALRSLLDHAVAGERHEASALSKEVWRAATAAFGPPAYHPFTMPGFL